VFSITVFTVLFSYNICVCHLFNKESSVSADGQISQTVCLVTSSSLSLRYCLTGKFSVNVTC